MLARLLVLMRNSVAAPGQQLFSSSGTFTVPVGVTSICAVAVGRGKNGGAGNGMGTPGKGGEGGTLSYTNSISVTPGESLTVTIATSTSSSTGQPVETNPVPPTQWLEFLQLIESGQVSGSTAYQRLFPALLEKPTATPTQTPIPPRS